MADEQDKAPAEVPADPTAEELDLEAMGLEDVELTEEEQVALAAASARPARKVTTSEAAAGKGRATPKQRRHRPEDEERRSNPVEFTRESIAELKKVVWPTPTQLQQYFVVVLVFVLIMIGIVSLLDLGFGSLLFWIFG